MGFAPKDVQFPRGAHHIGFDEIIGQLSLLEMISPLVGRFVCIFMDEKELEIFC